MYWGIVDRKYCLDSTIMISQYIRNEWLLKKLKYILDLQCFFLSFKNLPCFHFIVDIYDFFVFILIKGCDQVKTYDFLFNPF